MLDFIAGLTIGLVALYFGIVWIGKRQDRACAPEPVSFDPQLARRMATAESEIARLTEEVARLYHLIHNR